VIAAAKDGLYVLVWRDLGVGGSAWKLSVNEAHELVREVLQALGETRVPPEDDE